MIYLKLDRDENLSVTQMDRLFYYDPLQEQIQFLVPKSVGEGYSYSAAYQTDDAPKQLAPLSRNAADYNQDYMILNFHDDAMLDQRCGKLSISLIAVDDSTGEAVVTSNHAFLNISGPKIRQNDAYFTICNLPAACNIGFEGEKNFRYVQMDVSEWLAEYPDGIVQAAVLRPCDESASLVAIAVEDNAAVWTVDAWATQEPGVGYMQFILVVGETVVGKSALLTLHINDSIDIGDEPPVDPDQTWFAQILEASAAAISAAESAADSADDASASASEAASSAEYAETYKTEASASAESAGTYASQAEQSAQNASGSAQQASDYATAAAQSAQAAGSFATAAASSANDAASSAQEAAASAQAAGESATASAASASDSAQSASAAQDSKYDAEESATAAQEAADRAEAAANKPFVLKRRDTYLYDVNFLTVAPDNGSDFVPAGGCTSFVRDGKLYRNLDWNYDENATFHMVCPGFEGCAFLNGLTATSLDDDLIKQLPYRVCDGKNSYDIMVSTHVLYNDWDIAGDGSIPLTKLPYMILTNVTSMATLEEEISAVLDDLYVPAAMAAMEYLIQVLVTDGTTTYVVRPNTTGSGAIYEVVDITENPKLANFLWVPNATVVRTALQNRPTGVERWNMIGENTELSELRFTKCYEEPSRLSEFIGIEGTTKDSTDAELEDIYERAHAAYLDRERDGSLWQTMHSVVYGPAGMEHLWVQENWFKDFADNVKQYADMAQASAELAQTYSGDASQSAQEAAASASSASTSAATAESHATDAGESASDAAESATASAASASAAAGSAASASTSATNAAESETNAAASESSAASSASSAASSASEASGYADNASASASSASTAQTAAETAQTAAESAQTSAETAATNAAASAASASSSATAASGSASSAATSATAAGTAKTAAETAQAAAEAAQDGAETAETNAVAAKTAAETAQTAAESAQTGAETAETNAETAQAAAETAQESAEASALQAAHSASQLEFALQVENGNLYWYKIDPDSDKVFSIENGKLYMEVEINE